MYDVIVIGARCAGSPTAMLLARKGYKVLLADRKSFPSDTISTHFLWQGAIARLKHWGLLDALTARVAHRYGKSILISAMSSSLALRLRLTGWMPLMLRAGACSTRFLLTPRVSRAPKSAKRFLVTGIVTEGSHVKGITGSAEGGARSELHAKVVVGADGAESMVASAMNARKYELRLAGCAIYYSHWRDVAADGFDMYLRDGFAAGLFPTHDGDTCILAAWTHDAFPHAQRDVAHTYRPSAGADRPGGATHRSWKTGRENSWRRGHAALLSCAVWRRMGVGGRCGLPAQSDYRSGNRRRLSQRGTLVGRARSWIVRPGTHGQRSDRLRTAEERSGEALYEFACETVSVGDLSLPLNAISTRAWQAAKPIPTTISEL